MTLLIRIFKEEIANSLKSPRAPGRQSVSGRYATLSGIHWKLRLRIDCRRPEFPCSHQQATDLKSCQCSSCQPVPGFQRVKWSEVADGEKKNQGRFGSGRLLRRLLSHFVMLNAWNRLSSCKSTLDKQCVRYFFVALFYT